MPFSKDILKQLPKPPLTEEQKATMSKREISNYNLQPGFNEENARAMQAAGVAKRMERKAELAEFKETADLVRRLKKEEVDVDSLTLMKVTMIKYVQEGKWDDVARIASMIAPYQHAKLSSTELNTNVEVSTMSNEELLKIVTQAQGIALTPGNEGDHD